jgi:hypothetical protein
MHWQNPQGLLVLLRSDESGDVGVLRNVQARFPEITEIEFRLACKAPQHHWAAISVSLLL